MPKGTHQPQNQVGVTPGAGSIPTFGTKIYL